MSINKVGKDIAADERWNDVAASYADDIESGYHSHRFDMINLLIGDDDLSGKRVIDFGCGEGIFMEELANRKATVWGCDPCQQLVDRAHIRMEAFGEAAELVTGGVETLSRHETSSIDYLFALNVLAYLTAKEELTFYNEAKRIMRPDSVMIITHSNELFDLYTLNKYTVAFHRHHFSMNDESISIDSLLSHPDKPERSSFNIRENPLSYRFKLAAFGFDETQQEFANLHPHPPLLMDVKDFDDLDSRDYANTGNWNQADRWKQMFMCSMYGSRSVRSEAK
jgi:2-polyprenyl-3-methyl-5-hydroxy-6-metoxy-1,4-benzoquinol methylase